MYSIISNILLNPTLPYGSIQDQLKQEQQDLKHKQEIMFAQERQIRLEQIEQRKLLRETDRQQRIAAEQADMARARRLAEDEEERKQRKKASEKRAQDLVLEDNERNKQIRAEELRKQRDYESMLNRQYE